MGKSMLATTVVTWLDFEGHMLAIRNLLAHERIILLGCRGLMWTNWSSRIGGYEGGKQPRTTVVFVRAFRRI
jgi:hypothetical protein